MPRTRRAESGTSVSSAARFATYDSCSRTRIGTQSLAALPRSAASRSGSLADEQMGDIGTEHIESPPTQLPRPIDVIDRPCHDLEARCVRPRDRFFDDRGLSEGGCSGAKAKSRSQKFVTL